MPIAMRICCALLPGLTVPVHAQSARTPAPPALKKLDIWLGDWTLSGTAQDTPNTRAYRLHWQLHERWALDGHFLLVNQTWNGNGQTLHALELLTFDPARRVYTNSGFGSDGSTWSATGTFDNSTMSQRSETVDANGNRIRCLMIWRFSEGGTALAGKQRCEKNGHRWTAIDVSGRKAGTTTSK